MIRTGSNRWHLRFDVIAKLLVFLLFLSILPVFPQTETEDDELGRIHFGDVIDVDFIGSIEYDWRGSLTPDGYLDGLDELSGQISGLCREPAELAKEIERIYSTMLRSPQVVVTIIDKSKRPIAKIDGAVRSASRLSIRRKARLNEVLSMAGGLTDDASGEIEILRPAKLSCNGDSGNEGSLRIIKVSDHLKGDEDANPYIYSGDLIDVRRAVPIYVFGAVQVPRALIFREGMTLQKAIDAVGGRGKNADTSRVVILRRGPQGLETVAIQATDPKKGIFPDEILQVFDIIVVPSRGEAELKFPPVLPGQSSPRPEGELPLLIIDR